MKNIAQLFTPRMQQELQKHLGVRLSDEHDYADEELESLFCLITDQFPYDFTPGGEPMEMGRLFEDILDVFYRNNLPT